MAPLYGRQTGEGRTDPRSLPCRITALARYATPLWLPCFMLMCRKGVPWTQTNFVVVHRGVYGTVKGHHQKVSSAEGLIEALTPLQVVSAGSCPAPCVIRMIRF